MTFLIQLLFAGIAIGSIYALVGHAFNVTYRTLKILNFGHGPFMMISVMIALALYRIGLPLYLSMLIAAASIILCGIVVERIAVRPLLKTPGSHGWLVSTLGAGIILQALATKIWGAQAMGFPSYLFSMTDNIDILGVHFSLQYLMIIVCAAIVMFLLEFLIEKTIWGRSMKATAYDAEFAQLIGVNTKAVAIVSFALSVLFASVAGFLVAPVTGIDPAFGMELMLKGFVVIIIGGIGSPYGAFFGGLSVGIFEMLANGYISSQIGNSLVYTLLIVALIVRPTGIFGKAEVVKV